MEITEKMASLVETYRSSSSSWRSQSDDLMSSSDASSDGTPISHRINPRTDPLNRYPPLSQLNSSRMDYNIKSFARDAKFRDFEPERKMRRNNWENRTFSRGSAESKNYHEQVRVKYIVCAFILQLYFEGGGRFDTNGEQVH